MGFFKNKHLLMAMIVAPILGVLTYYALDTLVSEPPQAAEEGKSYQLLALPNCRRVSGVCGLKNGDFDLELRAEWMAEDRLVLMLKSVFPLDGVMLGLVAGEAEEESPAEMRPMDEAGLFWSLEVIRPDPAHNRLQVVASANQSLYFGDTASTFTQRVSSASD